MRLAARPRLTGFSQALRNGRWRALSRTRGEPVHDSVMNAPETEPIEVHLSDGGRVIVAFADASARLRASDQLVETLLRVDGSEHDLEEAITRDVGGLGLGCTTSTGRKPTTIVIG
jgi:hypothetical protein